MNNHIEISSSLTKDEHNNIIEFLKEKYPNTNGEGYSVLIRAIKSNKDSNARNKYIQWKQNKCQCQKQ